MLAVQLDLDTEGRLQRLAALPVRPKASVRARQSWRMERLREFRSEDAIPLRDLKAGLGPITD